MVADGFIFARARACNTEPFLSQDGKATNDMAGRSTPWSGSLLQPSRRTPALSIRKPLPELITMHLTPAVSEKQRKRPTVICLP